MSGAPIARPGVMHVAVDATALASGWSGIPKYTDRLVRQLQRHPDVELTLLANTSRRHFSRIDGVREVAAHRPGSGMWRNLFVRRWVARERPDVYWAPEMVLPHHVAAPTVVTVHDLTPLTMAHTKSLRAQLGFRALGDSVRHATRVIAVSDWTRRQIERVLGVAGDHVTVVGNGVDEQFRPGDRAAARSTVRDRWQLDHSFVLVVGTLERRKGLEVLFDAARLAATRGAPWPLVLAGAVGDRGAELAATADALPGCHRLGPVTDDELLSLYRAADVVAAPSLAEGFGIVPLEAMACGTPVVVAGQSGALEEIAGSAAIVVGSRTAAAWADGLDAARHDRERLVRAGTELAARYRWSSAADQTLAVLRAAAATGGG